MIVFLIFLLYSHYAIISFSVQRNFDPALHPFEVAREYTRALNAVKLERLLAKPFLYSLDGHKDGIQCMTKHPSALSLMFSGSYDGEVSIAIILTLLHRIFGLAFC